MLKIIFRISDYSDNNGKKRNKNNNKSAIVNINQSRAVIFAICFYKPIFYFN